MKAPERIDLNLEQVDELLDLFMSLIHTCNLAGVNPFDYLTVLQKNCADLAQYPEKWLPWNYNNPSASAND